MPSNEAILTTTLIIIVGVVLVKYWEIKRKKDQSKSKVREMFDESEMYHEKQINDQ